jgi:GTP pyrophosphokinase/guanosine-3',5'-bis(diphosphate) 3'-pyrophosphohydrolase
VVTLAKCCRPIPGDPIIGFFNPGRGIVIHRGECKNSNDNRKKHDSWLDVEWSHDESGEFPVEIRIELLNQVGSFATIVSTISGMQANIENVNMLDQDHRVSIDLITLLVRDRDHLADIIRKLKKLSIILKIIRVKA